MLDTLYILNVTIHILRTSARIRFPFSTRVSRPRNKSPPDAVDPSPDASAKSRYYEDRYRERESGRREPERERERERRDESHRSRH